MQEYGLEQPLAKVRLEEPVHEHLNVGQGWPHRLVVGEEQRQPDIGVGIAEEEVEENRADVLEHEDGAVTDLEA